MSWFKRHEETPFVASSYMATLTVEYSCGHSTVSSIIADEDETTYNSMDCPDCWRASHQLLQENQSLTEFVAENLERTGKHRWW